jgi:hypothetical protein
MVDNNFAQSAMAIGGTTKEAIYLMHILETLKSAQTSFDDGNVERFNLYVTYLENAVLDEKIRKRINTEKVTEEKRLKALNVYDDKGIEFRVAFIVVREVMAYLNDVMELEKIDVMGSIGIAEDIQPKESMDRREKEEYDLYEDDPLSQYPDYPEPEDGDE